MVSEVFIRKIEKMLENGKLDPNKSLLIFSNGGKAQEIKYSEIPKLLRNNDDPRGKFLKELIDAVSLGILLSEGKLERVFG